MIIIITLNKKKNTSKKITFKNSNSLATNASSTNTLENSRPKSITSQLSPKETIATNDDSVIDISDLTNILLIAG